MEVFHTDRSGLAVSKKTSEGYLECYGPVSRIGVFKYPQLDGTVRLELRLPEEVFTADSMGTLKLRPVTNEHPPGDLAMLTAETIKEFQVGNVGEKIDSDGKFLMASYIIQDKQSVLDVEQKRKNEISLGYRCDLEEMSGMYEGEAFTHIQRNIRYNHLALVPRGRAGQDVRIDEQEVAKMPTINIDSVGYEVSPQVEVHINKLRADAIQTDSDKKAMQKQIDEKQAELDAMKEEMANCKSEEDKKDKARKDAFEAEVSARVELLSKASEMKVKTDGLDTIGIKKAIILSVSPEAKLDGVSDDYINARFDAALEVASKKTVAGEQYRALHTDAKDTVVLDSNESYKKMKERMEKSYLGEVK